jgi:hypothetical protein
VDSNTKFLKFLVALVGEMQTSILHLSEIGYILPWKVPKSGKPIPKLLQRDSDWEDLLNEVGAYVDGQKAKYCGKGKVKPFSIQIVDTSEPPGDGKKVWSAAFYF